VCDDSAADLQVAHQDGAQIVHPSVFDTTRVPPGHGAVKIEGTIPYGLKEGPLHWDTIKERVADQLLAYYVRHTANLTKDKVLAKFLLSPLDIERMNPSMWRGSVHQQRPRAGCLRALPPADRGAVSNRRLDRAGRLSHRSTGTQRRDRHSPG
jgi:phytoene dehydrogenase-like protein